VSPSISLLLLLLLPMVMMTTLSLSSLATFVLTAETASVNARAEPPQHCSVIEPKHAHEMRRVKKM